MKHGLASMQTFAQRTRDNSTLYMNGRQGTRANTYFDGLIYDNMCSTGEAAFSAEATTRRANRPAPPDKVRPRQERTYLWFLPLRNWVWTYLIALAGSCPHNTSPNPNTVPQRVNLLQSLLLWYSPDLITGLRLGYAQPSLGLELGHEKAEDYIVGERMRLQCRNIW